MKTLLASGLLLAAALPATAQTGDSAPAPASADAAAGLTIDSPIAALMADPGAKAVVLATFPDMESTPGYDQFKVVSLRRLQPRSNGAITEQQLATIEAGLKALPAK
jgi:hypothetical protein